MPRPTPTTLFRGISATEAGAWLKARMRGRITQAELAERMGVQRTYLSMALNGRFDVRANPERLRIIAEALELTDEELREGLGVAPVAMTPAHSSRFLGKLSELTPELPKGRPVEVPEWMRGRHRPEDLFVVDLEDGRLGIFHRGLEGQGPALVVRRGRVGLVNRAEGEVLGRLIGLFTPVE